MNLISFAMKRPITICVLVMSMFILAMVAVIRMQRDILPDLGVPVIYVAQPYGGMDPVQMEGYLTYYYEYHFLFIAGVEHIESKNIQSTALMKLQFHPGTDMSQAMAETINYVTRARAYMPEGTLPPFVMRFDAGSEAVGKLVFESKTESIAKIQDYALNTVRPLFATLPGVSAPPPFGSSQRAIVIHVNPDKLRGYNLSPYDVAKSVSDANRVLQSGNLVQGTMYPMVKINSVVTDPQELRNVPLRIGTFPTIFLRDVATIEDGADIQTGYAEVNGRRAIFIPVTKRSDASTLEVVDLVKSNISRFQDVLPKDIKVSYEFDQSFYVRDAIRSLTSEGILGAILTGLMVLLFLQDWRSALIVAINIPCALAGALFALWCTGQTVNIMTLGGLALAIGILVDETTITIENIHTHLAHGKEKRQAVLDATVEMIVPCFLTMMCLVCDFLPSFFMVGVTKSLFIPLSLAVGFSIICSFLLARTLVPVLSVWLIKEDKYRDHSHTEEKGFFGALQRTYEKMLKGAMRVRYPAVIVYAASMAFVMYFLAYRVGWEIFPQADGGQFQVRMRAPTGTNIDHTEKLTYAMLDLIKNEVGANNFETSVGYVGAQSPNFPMNNIYLWTSGPQESITEITLRKEAEIDIPALKEKLRKVIAQKMPEVKISFEPSGILNRVMSQGSPTPIEVAVSGPDFEVSRDTARKVYEALARIPTLRDLQYGQVFEYPTVGVNVDRRTAGLLGMTAEHIGRTVIPATSSSRYVLRNYWADLKTGVTHQIQVMVPRRAIPNAAAVRELPIGLNGGAVPLRRLADVNDSQIMGEYDRYNMQRMVSVVANVAGEDMGHAGLRVDQAIKPIIDTKPRGVSIELRGQIAPMNQIFFYLKLGRILSICAIFLLLAANFESPLLSFAVICTIPAVMAGVASGLWVSNTTLNIESFIGAITAIGVAVSNSILIVTFAERLRMSGMDSVKAAVEGAKSRLRPILMTSSAMIMGMVPMALGLGESGQQTAPLGRAVIGGLCMSTVATLVVLPMVFAIVTRKKSYKTSSVHPEDLNQQLRQTVSHA